MKYYIKQIKPYIQPPALQGCNCDPDPVEGYDWVPEDMEEELRKNIIVKDSWSKLIFKERYIESSGIIGEYKSNLLCNVVPYPLDGMIYYVETSAESDDAWVANKPIQYIDEEGYHCGWGLATLCFKFEDLGEVYFFSQEEAKANLGNKEN